MLAEAFFCSVQHHERTAQQSGLFAGNATHATLLTHVLTAVATLMVQRSQELTMAFAMDQSLAGRGAHSRIRTASAERHELRAWRHERRLRSHCPGAIEARKCYRVWRIGPVADCGQNEILSLASDELADHRAPVRMASSTGGRALEASAVG